MQVVTMTGIRDAGPRTSSAARLHGVPDTHSSAPRRCQRCDILLGPFRCPNPECVELHGERAGTHCAWCRDPEEVRIPRSAAAVCTAPLSAY